MTMDRWMKSGAVAVMLMVVAGCSGNEAAKTSAPVELIVTNSQTLQRIDLATGATNCNQNVGTIQMKAILKNAAQISDQRFNDVRVTSYRVSYTRTDGGTQVPMAFVRSIDTL